MNEIALKIKLELINQERQMWSNTVEVYTIRRRVYQRLKDEQQVKVCESELVKCETALDEFDKMLEELRPGKKEP